MFLYAYDLHGNPDTLEKPHADILDFRSEVCCGGEHKSSPEPQQITREVSKRGCSGRAPGRWSMADLLPGSGELKFCRSKWT